MGGIEAVLFFEDKREGSNEEVVVGEHERGGQAGDSDGWSEKEELEGAGKGQKKGGTGGVWLWWKHKRCRWVGLLDAS